MNQCHFFPAKVTVTHNLSRTHINGQGVKTELKKIYIYVRMSYKCFVRDKS